MDKINGIINRLEKQYPDAECELEYKSVFTLLVATVLSAQCTDKRVNEVTSEMFKTYYLPEHFAYMDNLKLEKMIYSCGFYHNKAANIIRLSRDILENHNGNVPDTVEGLMTLSGVGRKTANVVYAEGFGGQAIAVDTHVFRVSKRLGLSNGKTPDDVERDLNNVIPQNLWSKAHHLLIFHGRYMCKSQRPECDRCPVIEFCTLHNTEK